jgi:hypothetical protein
VSQLPLTVKFGLLESTDEVSPNFILFVWLPLLGFRCAFGASFDDIFGDILTPEVIEGVFGDELSFSELPFIVGLILIDRDSASMREAFQPLPLVVAPQVFQQVNGTILNYPEHSFVI